MKRIKEQYYTKKEVASDLVKTVMPLVSSLATVIEPSAGKGVFVDCLIDSGVSKDAICAYDIDPKHSLVDEQDFLETVLVSQSDKTIVIGNPPFGRQSCLAKKFIKKCCSIADTVCFILPKSFKKQSMNISFGEFFHLLYEQDLPSNSFIFNDSDHDVPCVFQVWKKMDHKRRLETKNVPNGKYTVVKKSETPNAAFRRVGANCGKFFFQDIPSLSIQSNIFIKFQTLDDKLKEKLITAEWTHNNTCGQKSISKNELIGFLNSITNQEQIK